MKIENKIKYSYVKEALVRWVLGIDGQDGSTCDLIDVIPWGKELESVISWNDVCDEIIESFGNRTDEKGKLWDAVIILTNKNEFERFDKFITEKTNNVMNVYQGIIDKANKLCNIRYEITISQFVGLENNVAKYETIYPYHYFGKNLTLLANEVYDKLKVSDWERDDFIDSVHFALYNNTHIVFSSNYYLNKNSLHLEVKKGF